MTSARRVSRARRQLARLRAETEILVPVRRSSDFGPAGEGVQVKPGTTYRLSLTVRSLSPSAPIPTVVFTEVPA